METNVRKIALECLLHLEQKPESVSATLDRAIRRSALSTVDAALLTQLVYGVIRWRGRLDWMIQQLIRRAPERRTWVALQLGLYQLLWMDRIPDHAVIYESVELCRRSQKSLVNAVLRRVQRQEITWCYPTDPAQWCAIYYSYPSWLVQRWMAHSGREWTVRFCEVSNQQAPMTIRANRLRTSREDLGKRLKSEGFEVAELPYAEAGLRIEGGPLAFRTAAFREGLFTIQDEASMLVTQVLDPHPGEVVLDICAAPGVKTTHIAERMGNQGLIYAVDQDGERMALLEENCERLGVTIVRPFVADAQEVIATFQGAADRVLVDVPCSGFGTLRRHPEIRWRRRHAQIGELAQLQCRILKAAAVYVRPGGSLVYSTCTTEPEENEQVVRDFLETHRQFRLDLPPLPSALLTEERWVKTSPQEHGMDAFFIARFVREDG